jgi:hypothetical protein
MSRNLGFNLKDASVLSSSPPWILPLPVWGLLIASLLIKLALINLNRGEYTDGVVQLELWNSPVVFFPPGYSAAVWCIDQAVKNLLISGRLVSIFASVGALWVCFLLARQVLENEKEAVFAVLFLALSPVFTRWSLRVMTDSLFLLVFLICCYQWIKLLSEPNRSPIRFLGWIGLAVLIRYQGLFFLPFALFLIGKRRQILAEQGITRQFLAILIALVPWVVLTGWIGYRGFGHTQQFIERGAYGFWLTLSLYFSMFETYVLYWPWAVTYGLCIIGVVGFYQVIRGEGRERDFARFFAIATVVFLIVQSCFLSFQYRYLLPLVPLWCILAARGWTACDQKIKTHTTRQLCLYLIFINLFGMSAAVLYFQRAVFGDLSASAEFLHSAKFQRMVPANSRILSDEMYRDGVYNVKMKFWANVEREILYYPGAKPQVGDVIVLHNAYTDLTKAKEQLEKQFGLQVLQTWSSNSIWGEYAALPLLPDIMVNPPSLSLTSNPPCMAFRFVPQYYYSAALMLKEK